jgi:hypothetical protein
MLSRSPDRHSFQSQKYRDKLKCDPTDEVVKSIVDLYDSWAKRDLDNDSDSEWAKDNLEHDLRSTDWVLEKARESRIYSQNLYAAMCNREFTRNEVWPLLQGKRWSCSWRHAGGIIADMKQEGDYVDWYCTGIREVTEMDPQEFNELTYDQQVAYKESQAYVPEGVITDEIREDLFKLGWVPDND